MAESAFQHWLKGMIRLRNQGWIKKTIFPFKVSNSLVARSLVGVFALGFIDAGYSGDWSRIGVIPKETEDLLKIAAFVTVPLCIFLILNIYNQQES